MGRRNYGIVFASSLAVSVVIWSYQSIKSLKLSASRAVAAAEINKVMSVECIDCDETDERLVGLIKSRYILPPSELPYNWKQSNPDVSESPLLLPSQVDRLLEQKQNGFFVDFGPGDGEANSNSLFFELMRNWTGLLVETDRKAFKALVAKNRKAYIVNACEFSKCFPLFSVLLAMGLPSIDYLSLGTEEGLDILRSMPWVKLQIRAVTVSYGGQKSVRQEMVEFMGKQGYVLMADVGNRTAIFLTKEKAARFIK